MITFKQMYRWNAALALAAAVGLTGLTTGCQSSAEEAVPGDPGNQQLTATGSVDDTGADRAARVSLVEGTVAAREVGAEEWETLDANAAIFEDYEIYAEDDGRAELMLGDAKYVRLADGADVTLARFEPEYAQLEVTDGTVFLALDQYAGDEYYEISAPGGALVPREAGSYRVDVLPDGTTRVTVLRGTALINTPEGSFTASAGDVVNLGYEQANVEVISGGESDYRDVYYDWSRERDVYYTSYYNDYDYPAPIRAFEGRNDIYGLIGLAAFGVWQALDDDDDVYVWVPNDARNPNWSPYQAGYWDYSSRYGWSWVSSEPWGWAPYHYGRWDYNDRYGWNWAPYVDDRVVGVSLWRTERYRWRPAQVYFYQPPQTNYYAYVPLAPGEPYIPYSFAYAAQPDPRYVDFRPRYLRERRAVYVISPEELELRRAVRRADRDVLARLDGNGINEVRLAQLPRPQRLVAERKLARIERREDLRAQRNVVVTERSIAKQQQRQERAAARATNRDARAVEREQRQVARTEQRQVRKAQDRQLQVERRARRADDQVRAQNERQAREQRRVERRTARQQVNSQARVDRRAERQQQRAVQPDVNRQQQRVERQQRRVERQQQPRVNQQRSVQRVERQQMRQQQRATQPRAERQQVRQQQRVERQQVRQQRATQPRAERRAARQQQRATQPKAERQRRNQ